MASPKLFRKEALDRLATPEQLDRVLVVTTPRSWLAVGALAAILAGVVSWAFLGEVPTYVKAQGILLHRSGTVVDAVASGAGTVTRILPTAGDVVEAGDVVAEIANQEVAERYQSSMSLVSERATALEEIRAAAAAEDALIEENLVRQRERLTRLERTNRDAVEVARERLENHRQLFEERVVTRMTVERSQQALDLAQRELFGTLGRRDALESQELQRRHQRDVRISEAEARLRAAQRQVAELGVAVGTNQVQAPAPGRVTEIKTQIGAVLRAGQPVLAITSGEGDLGVLMYVPPADGRKVEAGMDALVSPSTVRREEYGSVKGTVENISEFPASLAGMVAVLQNRNLAQTFSEDGPPYAGRVVLERDPSTASGFAWTSPKAVGEVLSNGTLASVEVKTNSQAPITLVVPLLRETFGL